MTPRHKNKSKCPRCWSVRVDKRLDSFCVCNSYGQRIARDGQLIPSFDRRGEDAKKSAQLNLTWENLWRAFLQ